MNFKITNYNQTPSEFLSLLQKFDKSRIPTAKQFVLESEYRGYIAGKDFHNLSFILSKGETPLALVLIHYQNNQFTYNSRGVEILSRTADRKLLNQAIESTLNIANQYKIQKLKICDYDIGSSLSALGEAAYNHGALPTTKFEGIIDLSKTEDDIHKDLRKSYKSLINQGMREIDFKIINAEQPDHEEFKKFQSFHHDVAGRITRPAESWEKQYEMIVSGNAELITGYMDEHGLVSSSLTIDHGDVTYYGVAVYNRNLFDKPLGHASVYKSILRAKKRGQKLFSLGVIFQKGQVEEKEYNIGVFKKGFCKNLSTFFEWEIPV